MMASRMSRTILVVDDEESIRVMFRDYLEARGCRVFEAQNGAEAFNIASKEKPDVIIMDLSMPDVGGAAATSVLRELVTTARIPIIICSGQDEREARRLLSFGPKLRFMSKPVDLDKVWALAVELTPGKGKP